MGLFWVVGAVHWCCGFHAGLCGALWWDHRLCSSVGGETGVAFAGVNGPGLGGWTRAVVSRVSSASVNRRALVSWVSSVSVGRRALVSWVSCRAVWGLVVVLPGVFVGRW